MTLIYIYMDLPYEVRKFIQQGFTWSLVVLLGFIGTASLAKGRYTPKTADPVSEPWRWTHFEKLKGKSVRCVTQDEQGTMWFGVEQGVMSYNGHRWESFLKPENISDLSVLSLYAAKGEVIYVGTDSGIYLIASSTWKKVFPVNENLSVNVQDIIGLTDGSILASMNGNSGSQAILGMVHVKGASVVLYTSSSTKKQFQNELTSEVKCVAVPNDITISDHSTFDVSDLLVGQSGDIFIGISNDISLGKIAIAQYLSETSEFEFKKLHSDRNGLKIRSSIQIAESRDGKIWVVSSAHDLGVYMFDSKEWNSVKLSEKFGGVNSQNSIMACSDGSIWVEGHGRFFRLMNNEWREYQHPDIPVSTASRLFFYESADNNVWVMGKLGEVFKFDNTNKVWVTYKDLNFQFETKVNDVWFLTVNGEATVQTKNGWYSYNTLDGLIDTPVKLHETSYGEIWAIGSHEQVAATAYFDGVSWHKQSYPNVSWGLDHRAVYEARDGSLWFGCSVDIKPDKGHKGGAIRIRNPQQDKSDWIHYNIEDGADFRICYGIGESSDGKMWFGGRPLWYFDGDKWEIFDDIRQLREHVDFIETDSDENVWMVSRHYGVFKYDGKVWDNYTASDGLPSNNVLSIYVEDSENVWVLTYEGACHFDGKTWTSNIFPQDLLSSAEGSTLLKSSSGQVWFNHATNDWKRRSLTYPLTSPNANKEFYSISYNPDTNPPDTEITVYSEQVEQSGDNVIFWEGRDFFEVTNVEDLRYSWKLDDQHWSDFSPENYYRFSSLSPGTHKIRVRARDNEFNIDTSPAEIEILVLADWWRRPQFIIMAAIALIIIVVLQYRVLTHYKALQVLNLELGNKSDQLQVQNHKIESQRDRLRKTVEKIQKLSQSRLQFFTNVSHEFRTPLNLILGPIEDLLEGGKNISKELQDKYFYIIHRNANRILRLINQILEVYKIEDTTLEFKPTPGDLVVYTKEIVNVFEPLAEHKNIKMAVESDKDHLEASFDHDKIEKILFNLLSNAIKNVAESGRVVVKIGLGSGEIEDISESRKGQVIKIEVSDNGKGIPQEQIDKIFERFFHVDSEDEKGELHIGTGIGLSYIKDLVRTHRGSITVISDPGHITTFTVSIPFLENTEKESSPLVVPDFSSSERMKSAVAELSRSLIEPKESEFVELGEAHAAASDLTLLIVEDDIDTRMFLRHCFNDVYTVIEASNGIEGLSIANKEFPDLIISDIMMPEMDGIEFCRKIKSDFSTSHIPVLLLSARTLSEDKVKGYDMGADAYMEKPFNRRVLLSRVNTLIRTRHQLRKRFQTDLDLLPEHMEIPSLDESFIQQAIEAVEKYMDDSSLDAEKLGHEIGVSRVQLYRKIKALSGQTVNEFIKSVRLKHAARLLLDGKFTISQIAYNTGFSAPNHFATYFKKHFGTSPTKYLNRKVK